MIFFILSLIASLLLPFVLKIFLAKSRISTVKEKPMLLGLSTYISVISCGLLALYYHKASEPLVIKILIGSSLILLVGVIDDLKNLSVGIKLLGQLIVASIAVAMGVRTTIYYFPPVLNMLISIIWIVGLINALNLLDIMDGLCTGISFIISLSFLLMSVITKAGYITIFFWILSGSLLAAVVYNFPPAKLYLGDSGSMLVGFIFACSAIGISYAPDFSEGLSLFVPLLIVALPVYDLTFTIFMRRKKRIPIARKSKDHFVFIMKGLGFGEKKILALIYGMCILFSLSALFLKITPPSLKIWPLVFIAAALFLLTSIISKAESGLR